MYCSGIISLPGGSNITHLSSKKIRVCYHMCAVYATYVSSHHIWNSGPKYVIFEQKPGK